MALTLLLTFLSCLSVASWAQTQVKVASNGDLTIHRVVWQSSKQDLRIVDLVIQAKQAGHEFTVKHHAKFDQKAKKKMEPKVEALGKYDSHADGKETTLSFSKLTAPKSLYSFEHSIISGHVSYNNIRIIPTWSYIISAHGVEDGNYAAKTNKPWKHLSTLYFFNRGYTPLDTGLAEGYTELFEKGDFAKLKETASTNGQVVKTNDRVNEHYASYGGEFEAVSGVYRLKRHHGRWQVDQVAQFPDVLKTVAALSDIATVLETQFGPGDIYWNSCRSNTGISNMATDFKSWKFSDLVHVLHEPELQKWRASLMENCKLNWQMTVKEATENKGKVLANLQARLDPELGHYQGVFHDADAHRRLVAVVNHYKNLVEAVTIPTEEPHFTATTCLRPAMAVVDITNNLKSLQDAAKRAVAELQHRVKYHVERSESGSDSSSKPIGIPGGGIIVSFARQERKNLNEEDYLVEQQEMRNILRDMEKRKRVTAKRYYGGF